MIATIEYDIASAALRAKMPPDTQGPIVISSTPTRSHWLPDLAAYEKAKYFTKWPQLSVSAVSDLLEREQAPEVFEEHFDLGCQFTLLSEFEIKDIFGGKANWERFYERYPNSHGIFYLSRAGVDERGSQAVIHFGNQWQGRAGRGFLLLLERSNGVWSLSGEASTWLS
jgi:hypothetical protein